MRSPYKPGKDPNHIEFARSQEELWSKLNRYKDRNTYFSTASFYDGLTAEAENVAAKQCFYLDFDCEPAEALAHIGQLLVEAGLPEPSYLVNSGNGLHAWWALDRATS